MSGVVELLIADYGLDPTRGGMLGTLRAHVEARLAHLQIGEPKFIERLRRFVRAGQNQQALALADQFSQALLPQLSADELDRVSGMIEIAEMAVDLEQWSASHGQGSGRTDEMEAARSGQRAGFQSLRMASRMPS